jgi:uncharacterized cupredoxin-like copper-binding protein
MNRLMFVPLLLITMALAACTTSSLTLPTPAATQEINLTAQDILYEQKTLEVVAGQPVKLTFSNQGTLEHDFNILKISVKDVKEPAGSAGHAMGHTAEQPDLHVAAPIGQSSVLEFTATEPGIYEFYCSVAGHKEAGMVGTLRVVN